MHEVGRPSTFCGHLNARCKDWPSLQHATTDITAKAATASYMCLHGDSDASKIQQRTPGDAITDCCTHARSCTKALHRCSPPVVPSCPASTTSEVCRPVAKLASTAFRARKTAGGCCCSNSAETTASRPSRV